MGLEALLTGHLLCERYRVEHVVGSGGMGAVYGATDVRLERRVALKVITAASADVAARGRLRARFHREARAAARLQHPNVVTVFDFGTDPRLDLDFLVMELLRGEDVARCLERIGTFPLPAGLELTEQAARGVAAGHQAGLVHRDIKPGNLFLVEGGLNRLRVCVLDFGIVQHVADGDDFTATQLTVAGRAPHSPAYAAPEQLRGEPRLTAAADVWGLGATAFQVLTGQRPFDESAQRRMMDGMAVPAPSARARMPGIPDAVDDVLRIALSHQPADRFRDAAAFASAVADARRGAVARIAAAAPARPAAAGAEDDHTLLEPVSRLRHRGAAGPPRRVVPPLPGGSMPRDATLVDAGYTEPAVDRPGPDAYRGAALPARAAETPPATPAAAASMPPPARHWAVRAASAVGSFAITLAAVGIAAACGVGMFEAFYNDLTEPFYATVAGLTVSLPWAVHRMFGRRGSYVFGLIGCVTVAIGVFRFVVPLANPETALVALAPAQLLAAGWIERATRRRRMAREPAQRPTRFSP